MRAIIKSSQIMTVPNKGNLVVRRAFAERDGVDLGRVKLLARISTKAMSTSYQMTEEVGDYGSGTPSHLHIHCELIRALEDGGAHDEAHEMAEYPRVFLSQLRRGNVEEDAVTKMNTLLKSASDANYLLAGRDLKDLPLGQQKEFAELMMTAVTAASGLAWMTDFQIHAAEETFSGAPIQRESRIRAVGEK